jgi:hypothetical protein
MRHEPRLLPSPLDKVHDLLLRFNVYLNVALVLKAACPANICTSPRELPTVEIFRAPLVMTAILCGDLIS